MYQLHSVKQEQGRVHFHSLLPASKAITLTLQVELYAHVSGNANLKSQRFQFGRDSVSHEATEITKPGVRNGLALLRGVAPLGEAIEVAGAQDLVRLEQAQVGLEVACISRPRRVDRKGRCRREDFLPQVHVAQLPPESRALVYKTCDFFSTQHGLLNRKAV